MRAQDEHEEHCHSHGCSCCNGGHEHEEHEEEMSWWKPALSLAMLLAGIVMEAMGVQWFQHGWVRLAWYAAAWLPTGLGVLREAIEEAREGEVFSEFLLMSVASLGAFAIGEYPEAVAVMALYCIGEALQDRAVSRARGNIQSLIAFRPTMPRLCVTGNMRRSIQPKCGRATSWKSSPANGCPSTAGSWARPRHLTPPPSRVRACRASSSLATRCWPA